jgi:hypothetical protein
MTSIANMHLAFLAENGSPDLGVQPTVPDLGPWALDLGLRLMQTSL